MFKFYYFIFSFFMGSFIDAEGNEIARTKCEIYTRVMGYYRPVTQFNNGKKSEFYTRTCFDGQTVGA
jgi:ribonucleoside-triphosphate reductase